MKLVYLFALILLTGCNPLFCTWDSGYTQLRTEPDRTDIIGEYELTNSSKDFLASRKFTADKYTLTLSEAGDFIFNNCPDLLFNDWAESNQKLIDKTGKWSVSCAESYDCLIELTGVCVVTLAEKNGQPAILIAVGDGDECNGLVYEKMKK
jgi:hypothetical protein